MSSTAEKIRAYQGPVLFERAMRPFFLGAGIYAALAMPLWVAYLATGFETLSHLPPREWHLHEMWFGYLAAVMAGFLLTAVPNWTGRLPVIGWPLALLFGLWIAGRAAMTVSSLQPVLATIVDASFLVMLAAMLWREVLIGKNYRNIPVCLLASLFALANIAFHALWLSEQSTEHPERLASAVAALLLILLGGRIIPSFTSNWMKRQSLAPLPEPFGRFDRLAILVSVASIAAWLVFPYHLPVGLLMVLAAAINFFRLYRWRGGATFVEPLVTVLHVGFLWLPVWFALMALSVFRPDLLAQTTALHALSAGAVGTMTLAMMTRASLGHSGRPLTAGAGTVAIYALVAMGAILRIVADLPADVPEGTMTLAGALWSAGFLLFVILWWNILTRPNTA